VIQPSDARSWTLTPLCSQPQAQYSTVLPSTFSTVLVSPTGSTAAHTPPPLSLPLPRPSPQAECQMPTHGPAPDAILPATLRVPRCAKRGLRGCATPHRCGLLLPRLTSHASSHRSMRPSGGPIRAPILSQQGSAQHSKRPSRQREGGPVPACLLSAGKGCLGACLGPPPSTPRTRERPAHVPHGDGAPAPGPLCLGTTLVISARNQAPSSNYPPSWPVKLCLLEIYPAQSTWDQQQYSTPVGQTAYRGKLTCSLKLEVFCALETSRGSPSKAHSCMEQTTQTRQILQFCLAVCFSSSVEPEEMGVLISISSSSSEMMVQSWRISDHR